MDIVPPSPPLFPPLPPLFPELEEMKMETVNENNIEDDQGTSLDCANQYSSPLLLPLSEENKNEIDPPQNVPRSKMNRYKPYRFRKELKRPAIREDDNHISLLRSNVYSPTKSISFVKSNETICSNLFKDYRTKK